MKKGYLLVVFVIISSLICGCEENTAPDGYTHSIVSDYVNQDNDRYVDELERILPNSKYSYYAGSPNGTDIVFYDDIMRTNDTLKGSCRRIHSDGSSSDKVSFRYNDEILYINLTSDEKIAKGYKNSTIEYVVVDNLLLKEDCKINNLNIPKSGNFKALISEYIKFNKDGTVKVIEYKYGDTVIFPENYYTGTYKRDGNLIICNTYCAKEHYSSQWYMYVDDNGSLYTEVYINEQKQTSSDSNNSSNNTIVQQNSSSQKVDNNSGKETNTHTHIYSNATCTQPQKCFCGVTKGAALGHNYLQATCANSEICERCGITRGKALGCKYEINAPFYCCRCNNANPNALAILRDSIEVVSVEPAFAIKSYSISNFRLTKAYSYAFGFECEVECLKEWKSHYTKQLDIVMYNDSGNAINSVYRMIDNMNTGDVEKISINWVVYNDIVPARIEIGKNLLR